MGKGNNENNIRHLERISPKVRSPDTSRGCLEAQAEVETVSKVRVFHLTVPWYSPLCIKRANRFLTDAHIFNRPPVRPPVMIAAAIYPSLELLCCITLMPLRTALCCIDDDLVSVLEKRVFVFFFFQTRRKSNPCIPRVHVGNWMSRGQW